jgi:hypothetical protein
MQYTYMMLLIVFEIIEEKDPNASELLHYSYFSEHGCVLCDVRSLVTADSSHANNTMR